MDFVDLQRSLATHRESLCLHYIKDYINNKNLVHRPCKYLIINKILISLKKKKKLVHSTVYTLEMGIISSYTSFSNWMDPISNPILESIFTLNM